MNDYLPIYMKPGDWVNAYHVGIPHWAESNTPSPLAGQFLGMLTNKIGNRILEIGIGNGRDSIFFCQQGNQVVGIDIVQEAVSMAKNNAKQCGLTNIEFQLGNAEKLSFSAGSFDGVYSVSVLHATDLSLSLSEISRVMADKAAGLIYLYEKTIREGKEYRFTSRNKMEGYFKQFSLLIEDSWDVIHTGHEGEQTTVLIYKLRKTKK